MGNKKGTIMPTDKYMKITESFFNEEVMRFRAMMQDKRNSIDWIDRAIAALGFVYIRATATGMHPNTTAEAVSRMEVTMTQYIAEWARRKTMMLMIS